MWLQHVLWMWHDTLSCLLNPRDDGRTSVLSLPLGSQRQKSSVRLIYQGRSSFLGARPPNSSPSVTAVLTCTGCPLCTGLCSWHPQWGASLVFTSLGGRCYYYSHMNRQNQTKRGKSSKGNDRAGTGNWTAWVPNPQVLETYKSQLFTVTVLLKCIMCLLPSVFNAFPFQCFCWDDKFVSLLPSLPDSSCHLCCHVCFDQLQ